MKLKILRPPANPRNILILITLIVLAGITGSLFLSAYFAVAALSLWICYTFILSYLQFKKGRKYEITGLTTFLLNPQLRFFVFVFIATIGILSIFYMTPLISYICLLAWWLFSYNFYRHYAQFKQDKH